MKLIETQVNNRLTREARKSFKDYPAATAVQVVSISDPGRTRGYILMAAIDYKARAVNLGDSVEAASETLEDVRHLMGEMGFGD